ncbi:hypothetical protein D9V32_11925 [Mycetocola tolaasinivorans]|uniref:Uncharacterized protein n=1 Tax=Mycetocola tolaasinivorans TaxID=76635 RepID=A0A3L7A586_9MICO|nr:hypothetical protein [Mycetocola tolaasinivorans]RLP74741.1 hypothetical protein D9V32_11925 [Mycetocola tolaasinivorans]
MTVGSRVDRGEMHSVRLVAQDLSSVEEFRNGLLAVRDGMNHLEEAGHSQAVSRLRTVAAPMQHSIEAIAQVRVRAGEILFRYAAQVLDLQDQARVFRLRRSQAQDLQRRHTAALFEIRADTSPEAGGRALRMENQVEDTRASLSQIERGLAELDQARVSLDRSCARDLTHCREVLARVSAGPSGSGNVLSDGLTGFADFAARMVVNAENVAAPELERILRGDRTPEQVAELWAGLDLDSDGIAALPIKDILTLANTDGLPFWVRDVATRRVLDYALKWPTGAFHLLGFAGDALADADAVAEFIRQIEAYDRAGREADRRATLLNGRPDVQLIGIGNQGDEWWGVFLPGTWIPQRMLG